MTKQEEIKLPMRQEIVDAMLSGTTVWWELNDRWDFIYAECLDVYDRIFPLDWNKQRAIVKIYDRILSAEERHKIGTIEEGLFNAN